MERTSFRSLISSTRSLERGMAILDDSILLSSSLCTSTSLVSASEPNDTGRRCFLCPNPSTGLLARFDLRRFTPPVAMCERYEGPASPMSTTLSAVSLRVAGSDESRVIT